MGKNLTYGLSTLVYNGERDKPKIYNLEFKIANFESSNVVLFEYSYFGVGISYYCSLYRFQELTI